MASNGSTDLRESVIATLSLIRDLAETLTAVSTNVAEGHTNTAKALEMIRLSLDDLFRVSRQLLAAIEDLDQRVHELEL